MALPQQHTRAVVDGEVGAQPRGGRLGEDDGQSGGGQGHGHREHGSIHRPPHGRTRKSAAVSSRSIISRAGSGASRAAKAASVVST